MQTIIKGDCLSNIFVSDKQIQSFLSFVAQLGIPVRIQENECDGHPNFNFIADADGPRPRVGTIVETENGLGIITSDSNYAYRVVTKASWPSYEVHKDVEPTDKMGEIVTSKDKSLVLLVYHKGKDFDFIFFKGALAWSGYLKSGQTYQDFINYVESLGFSGNVSHQGRIVKVEKGPDCFGYYVVSFNGKYEIVNAKLLRNL